MVAREKVFEHFIFKYHRIKLFIIFIFLKGQRAVYILTYADYIVIISTYGCPTGFLGAPWVSIRGY